MNFLDAIPVPPEAKSYVVGLLPILALAIGIVVSALANKVRRPTL